jgi:hypothetical protein
MILATYRVQRMIFARPMQVDVGSSIAQPGNEPGAEQKTLGKRTTLHRYGGRE